MFLLYCDAETLLLLLWTRWAEEGVSAPPMMERPAKRKWFVLSVPELVLLFRAELIEAKLEVLV